MLCSWIRGLNIVKLAILPKLTFRVIAIPIKTPVDIFSELDKLIPKFTWTSKVTQNSQNDLEKELESWRPHSSLFPNLLQSYSNQDSVVLA